MLHSVSHIRVMDTSFDLMSFLDTLSVADLQPTPPPTPVDEEPFSIMAALSVAANFDITDQQYELPTVSSTPQEDVLEEICPDPPSSVICPVPGCTRRVKRLWNHLFQFHKKKGNHTGKVSCTLNSI